MNRRMWKIILLVLSPAILFGLYVLGVILFATITNFSPEETEKVEVEGKGGSIAGNSFTILIWNIGYGGLGANADFFYDGGEMVRSPKEDVEAYNAGINEYLQKQFGNIDFILLQEVDRNSKRSYGIDQFTAFQEMSDNYTAAFAANYKVKYVPLPFAKPMGRVHSGLASFSKFQPTESIRYQFPGNYGYPKSVFFLDRCFLLQRFSLENGKELVVINTHNSAYDDGSLKAQQMDCLKGVLAAEYEKGNYVIVGGDWNQCPPDFDFDKFASEPETEYTQSNVPGDYLESWTWAFDPNTPTNRKVSVPYAPGETFTTLIDFYLLSPNLKVERVEGVDMDFAWSDHQPVLLEFSFE